MAKIRPFNALRYTELAGDISTLVAPPYDVLSPEQREAFAQKNEHNVVWLTLPEGRPDDRSQFIKYARAATRLAEWRRDGFLDLTPERGYYRYRQTFLHPVTHVQQTRTQLMVTLKLEPYEKGVVLPHEQTFPKHKQDRLRLLEATRTHLESIYGLYRDEQGSVNSAMNAAQWTPVAQVSTEDGIEHHLDLCAEDDQVAALTQAFEREKIWIADGHHRYETALSFRAEQGEKSGEIPEDYMLISLSSIRDPGLALLPTHRIVNGFPFKHDEVMQRLQTFFNVRSASNDDLPGMVLELDQPGVRVFGVALPGEAGVLATMEEPRMAVEWIDGDGSDRLKMLDVSILHEIILNKCFGITGTDQLEFTRDAQEAVERTKGDSASASIITNAPSVEDMRVIAEGGEKMPQKSTFYYPKLLSGLLFFAFEDF